MKITNVNVRSGNAGKSAVKKSTGSEFSTSLDLARRESTEKELAEMLKKINRLGEEIKEKPSLERIKEYKRRIRDYLSFILKHYYKLIGNHGRYSTQLLVRVEVINKKIEELTNEFINRQQGTIGIIGKIDEIAGLLVDLYR